MMVDRHILIDSEFWETLKQRGDNINDILRDYYNASLPT
jgi:hypothetical protein